jgi:hypothetical protein
LGQEDEPAGQIQQTIYTPGWLPLSSSSSPANLRLRHAMASTTPTQLEVWATDGATHSNFYHRKLTGATWGSWDTDGFTNPVLISSGVWASGGPAAAYRSSASVVDMVARGSDNHIYHAYRSGTTWSGWTGDAVLNSASTYLDPAISILGTKLHVWAVGVDNKLYVCRWNGSSWTWYGAYTPSGTVTVSAAPSAVAASSTTVDVTIKGSDGNVWFSVWDDSTLAFGTWTNLGHPSSTADTSSPAVSVAGSDVSVWATEGGVVWQKTYSSALSLWLSWTNAPSLEGTSTTATNPTPSSYGITVLNRGTTPASPIDIEYISSSNVLEYRAYYTSVPGPTVLLSPDRGVQFPYGGAGAVEGCNTVAQFENISYVIPPNKAGCGVQGGVFFGLGSPQGHETNMVRGDLDCFTGAAGAAGSCGGGASPICNMGRTNIWTAALIPASLSFTDGSGSAAAAVGYDAHFQRVGGTSNSLVVLEQLGLVGSATAPQAGVWGGVCRSAGQAMVPICRGAIMFLRSTNCNSSWSFLTALDPCNPSIDNAYGCPAYSSTGPAGNDRSSLVVAPGSSQTLYVTSTSAGNSSAAGDMARAPSRSLYRSNDAGATWDVAKTGGTTPIHDLSQYSGFVYPAFVGDKLFLLSWWNYGATATNAWDTTLRWYDGTTLYPVADKDAKIPALAGDATPLFNTVGAVGPSEWIAMSPIGQYGNEYFLRAIYAVTKYAPTRQSYRIRIIRVDTSTSTVDIIKSADIDATSAAGSLGGMVVVNQDHLDVPSTLQSSVSLLYWHETDSTDVTIPQNFGATRIRGCILRDLETTCSRFPLSITAAGTERTFPGLAAIAHYYDGAFFYDPNDAAGKTMKFLAQWTETPDFNGTVNQQNIHAQIVAVEP